MNTAIHSTPAHLWDGQQRLSGTLEIWKHKVVFRFDGFQKSHLNLVIPIWEILQVEEFLIFDISRNGLRIENQIGKADCFVLSEPRFFKEKIKAQMVA